MQQLYRSSMSINYYQQQNSVRRRPSKAVAFGLWAAAVCSLPTAHSAPFPQAPSPDPVPAPESPPPPPAEAAPPPTFEPIAAPAPGDTTTSTGPGTKPTDPVGPKPPGGTTTPGSTKTNTPVLSTTTLTSTIALPITTTTPNLNPIITVSRPPTTTTTSSSSTSSKSTIVATRAFPTESPYGQVIGPDKNGNLMLTVSLVVVFAVLAGMGLVVFCLFKRRSAKRRMHVFGGKGGSDSPLASTSGLGEMLAAASVKEGGAGGSGDSTNGDPRGNSGTVGTVASDMDLRRTMLQEMSERHHSALLSRRSSTLSIGGPPLQNASTPSGTPHSAPLQMLSPAMMAARPHSMGGAYSLDPNGSGTSLNDYRNMNRSSQYEEYYGGSSLGPANPPFLYNASSRPGSVNYTGSNEQLLMRPTSVTLSRRSSLSPGVCPQTPEMQSLPTRSKTISVGYPSAPQPHYAHSTTMPSPLAGPVSTAGYQRGSFGVSSSENLMASSSSSSSGSPDRHQTGVMNSSNSIRSDGSSGEDDSLRPQPRQHSNLVIPPSITTRPRSSVGLTNSMYGQPSMGSGYYQPPMPQPQQQYPHYPANGSGTAYYSQPLPYVESASYSGQQQSSSDSGKGTSAGTEKNTGSATEK